MLDPRRDFCSPQFTITAQQPASVGEGPRDVIAISGYARIYRAVSLRMKYTAPSSAFRVSCDSLGARLWGRAGLRVTNAGPYKLGWTVNLFRLEAALGLGLVLSHPNLPLSALPSLFSPSQEPTAQNIMAASPESDLESSGLDDFPQEPRSEQDIANDRLRELERAYGV